MDDPGWWTEWRKKANLQRIEDEPLPGAGLYRALFFPAFHPWCCVTVRDCGDLAEIELISDKTPRADQIVERRMLPSLMQPWREQVYLDPEGWQGVRRELGRCDAAALVDAINRRSRDGIACVGQQRAGDGAVVSFTISNPEPGTAETQCKWLRLMLRLALASLADERSRWMLNQAASYLPSLSPEVHDA